MVLEVILITVSCVLFVQMGLADAIQSILGFRFRIFSCVKCSTFWTNLIYLLATRHMLLLSVSASFIAAYSALWLALLCDAVAVLYNNLYEQVASKNFTTPSTDHAAYDAAKKSGEDEV